MNANTCAICGNIHDELFELTINGETVSVCSDCAEAKGFVRCRDCEQYIPMGDAHEFGGYEWVCEACSDAYSICEECGALIEDGEGHRVNPDTRGETLVCSDCVGDFIRCDDCGEYFTEGYMYTDNDTHVCHDCFNWHDWAFCGECGTLTQEGYWDDDRDETICPTCQANFVGRLNNYSFKPTPEFHFRRSEITLAERKGLRPSELVHSFGVELEVDHGNDQTALLRDLKDLDAPIYMKRDGSLDNGVEIVTHPCSLEYHAYELRWAEIARICTRHGYKSHDTNTCGLHIHVGRAGMGKDSTERQATAAKLVLLVRTLWPELVKFSRRAENKLDEWASLPTHWRLTEVLAALDGGLDTDEQTVINAALCTEHNGRYQAVNLTNAHTVEFRLFRGTLKRNTLIAAIQLVNNLTNYAMTHSAFECLAAKWTDVLEVGQFKELKAYCEARGI